MFIMKKNSGQSLLEYSIMAIIVIAALLTMMNYTKRSLQGRWKTSLDDLGDQYDPKTANTHVIHQMNATSNTEVTMVDDTVNGTPGFFTLRTDKSSSTERRYGTIEVGN